MNRILWVIQTLLALLFLFAGAMKFIMPVEEMTKQMPSMSGAFLHFIGACEVLGGLGLVLPRALKIKPWLTPLAAALLVIIMIGAMVITAARSGIRHVRDAGRDGRSLCLCRLWTVASRAVGERLEGVAVDKLLGVHLPFSEARLSEASGALFEKLAYVGSGPTRFLLPAPIPASIPVSLTQTKPGELFICRVIGNIVPPYPDAVGGVSATIEYAVGVLDVPAVVVCGHTDCGVMRGALNPDALSEHPNVA